MSSGSKHPFIKGKVVGYENQPQSLRMYRRLLMRILLTTVLFGYTFSHSLSAQWINSISFNKDYDFPFQSIFGINQAEDGTMWFGTSEGLVSFDGVNYRRYVHPKFGRTFNNLQFDPEGRIWCTNFSGQLFYLENDSLHLAYSVNGSDFINHYTLTHYPRIQLLETITGKIFSFDINDSAREIRVELHEEKFGLFGDYYSPNLRVVAIETSKLDYHNDTCIIDIYGNYTPNGWQRQRIKEGFCVKGKIRIGKTNDGDWIVGDFYGKSRIFRIHNDKYIKIYESDTLSLYNLNQMVVHNNEIWLLTDMGVHILDAKTGKWKNKALTGQKTSVYFEDRDGNIWIGTLDNGLHIIINRDLYHSPLSKVGLINRAVYDGKKYLYVQDEKGFIWRSLAPFIDYKKVHQRPLEKAPLFLDSVNQILYVGNKETNIDLKSLVTTIPEEDFVSLTNFKQAVPLSNKEFIATSYNKALISNPSIEADGYILDKSDTLTLRPYRCNQILMHGGVIYIDYVDGLFAYSKSQNPQQIRFDGDYLQPSSMIGDPNNPNKIWVSTLSGELISIENEKIVLRKSLPAMAQKLLVTPQAIFGVMKDGIFRLDFEDEDLNVMGLESGWLSQETIEFFTAKDTIFAIAEQQIQKVAIHDFCTYNDKLKLNVSYFIINGVDEDYDTKNFEISSQNNSFTIGLKSLSVQHRNKLIYQYRLNDENWISLPNQHPEIRLFNLNTGKYTIEARVCPPSMLCSESININFAVLPPYYQRWWFIATIFLTLTGFIGSIIFFYYRSKNRDEQLKSGREAFQKQIYQSRISALRAQMNPHFIFNALNTIQEFILTNKQDIASDYLADFADLMRYYLDQSNVDEISLQDEIELLQLYLKLENMRLSGSLKVEVTIDPAIDRENIRIPPMLIQPHVENSIKHGLLHANHDNKKLKIRFEKIDKGIKCIIEDNGIGRKTAKEINANRKHKSFSTGANAYRINLLNQMSDLEIQREIIDLYDSENNSPAGTRIILSFKSKNTEFTN
jgi:sensor histidine kinase YesM